MKVLNNGYVSLLESMGGDAAVIRNARRCWRSEDKSTPKSDEALIKHLLKAGHLSPFETMTFTFDCKAPLFVARQWFRHRMGSFNEESLRYCIANEDFYTPLRLSEAQEREWIKENKRQFEAYEGWVSSEKMPKEQARAILPIGTYTKYYWTVNGSSLMNFLRLRLDKHAQPEIQEYARGILEILLKEENLLSFKLFKEEILNNDI